MQKGLKKTLAVSFFLATALPGLTARAATGDEPADARVTVRLYNRAAIESETLERAMQVAAKIFRRTGVEIDWVQCDNLGVEATPACNQSPRGNEIILRILRRSKGARGTFKHITGGAAIRLSKEGGSGLITLFYDRVEELAKGEKLSRVCILGHAMAHEMGHLLLPQGRHARRGLMRAQLDRNDWERANQGALLFSRREAKALRAGVLARRRQQETARRASRD